MSATGFPAASSLPDWEQLLAKSVATASHPALCITLDGTVAWANQAIAELLRVPLADLIGSPISRIVGPGTAEHFARWGAEAAAGQATSWDADQVLRRGDGSRLVMHLDTAALMHEEAPVYLFANVHDVTDDRDAAAVLARQTESLERIARGESLSTVLNGLAAAVEANRPGLRCTILLLDEQDGGRLFTAAAPSMPPSFAEAIDGSLIGPHQGSCGVAAFRATDVVTLDIERDRDEAELRHASMRDPLTGLANRRLFLDELGTALRRARRSESTVAVLFLDVDHFKVFNDSMGHLVGDEILRVVASRVHDTIRPHDVVARFGGDEFTIFCENVNGPSETEEIAHRLREAIERPINLENGREIFLTASVGIALGSALAAPHELVADADAAMYQAKATGRAGVIRFDERMRARSRDRLHIQSALRRAIGNNEFAVAYQPQIDLRTGAMVAVEALLRWTSEDLGVIPPDKFIPVAEDSDLIMDIGGWVLEHACEQCRRWERPGRSALKVAVNASARQFARSDVFLETVRSVLASTELKPSQLRIEVTESTLANPVTTGSLVAELKQLGISLAIDDFGTGFSSLARLRSFAVDELKIDRSFIEGLENHPDDRAVVAAIIGMAQALRVDTVAEGVETAGQLEILRSLGCDRAQGYYLGRPMPAADITALIDATAT